MASTDELYRLALADVEAGEAGKILQQALEDPSEAAPRRVADALRSWTWKALTDRRTDAELRSWHDLMRRVAGRLAVRDHEQAVRVGLLSELVHESILTSVDFSRENVLQRAHTRAIVSMLARAKAGQIEREVIGRSLKLQQSNLTRVINMMVAAGLVTRKIDGRRVIVEITSAGAAAAAKLNPVEVPPIENPLEPATEAVLLEMARLIVANMDGRRGHSPAFRPSTLQHGRSRFLDAASRRLGSGPTENVMSTQMALRQQTNEKRTFSAPPTTISKAERHGAFAPHSSEVAIQTEMEDI